MTSPFDMPGVKGYVGLWGSGKTLGMVEECIYLEKRGVEIYTNFGFDSGHAIETFDDLLLLCAEPVRVRRHIALDELGMLLPARGYRDWPAALDVLFLQGRKFGITLSYSVQDFDMVDSNIRRLTGLVCECRGHLWRNVAPKGEPPDRQARLFSRAWRTVGKGKVAKKRFGLDWRVYNAESGARYDTYGLISTAQRVLNKQAAEIRKNKVVVVIDKP